MSDLRTPARQNFEWLAAQFQDLLIRQEPRSVLDVGCGAGMLLRRCQAEGIAVRGLDRGGPRLEELHSEGFKVQEGSATDLPLADRSVDWVTLRHVPHHLENPGAAFAEALRVAGSGVLLAEPWFDPNLPSQRNWHAVDCWEKRQDRRTGMFHAEVLDLATLISCFPDDYGQTFELEVQTHLQLRDRSVAEFKSSALARLADLPPDAEQQESLVQLLATLNESGLSWHGSQCVLLRRKPSKSAGVSFQS